MDSVQELAEGKLRCDMCFNEDLAQFLYATGDSLTATCKQCGPGYVYDGGIWKKKCQLSDEACICGS